MASRAQRQQARRQAAAQGQDNRGGPRQGTPGQTYGNRTDLNQAARVAPGQTYGTANAQLTAQTINPLPDASAQTAALAPQQPDPRMAQAAALAQQASALPDLTGPTQRPSEPVTAGAPLGPGANSIPGLANAADTAAEAFLRSAYAKNPNTDLARILATIDAKRPGP